MALVKETNEGLVLTKSSTPLVVMACRLKPFPYSGRRTRKSPFRSTVNAKKAERAYLSGARIGFTARSSLKSMGRIPRSSGCYELGAKYR